MNYVVYHPVVPVPDDGEEWEEVEVDELGLTHASVRILLTLMHTGNPIEETARTITGKK